MVTVDVVGVNNNLALGKKGRAFALVKKHLSNFDKIILIGDTDLDFAIAKEIKAVSGLVAWGHYSFRRLSLNRVCVCRSVLELKKEILSLI